jgi:hypothetical protein
MMHLQYLRQLGVLTPVIHVDIGAQPRKSRYVARALKGQRVKLASLGGWPGVSAAAAATAGAVATGGYFAGVFDKNDPVPAEPPAALVAPAETPSEAAPVAEAAPVVVAQPAPEATPEPAPEAVPSPEPPRFDVVRVEPDGATLVAGSAAPAWPVAVILDGSEMGR